MTLRKKIILSIVLVIGIIGFFWLINFEKKDSLGSASLSWNENLEDNLAGYKIYYGTAPRVTECPKGGYEEMINVGKKTNYEIKNLEPGKTYYFSVTSYNIAKKESCFSEEMKKDIEEVKKDMKTLVIDKIKSLIKK